MKIINPSIDISSLDKTKSIKTSKASKLYKRCSRTLILLYNLLCVRLRVKEHVIEDIIPYTFRGHFGTCDIECSIEGNWKTENIKFVFNISHLRPKYMVHTLAIIYNSDKTFEYKLSEFATWEMFTGRPLDEKNVNKCCLKVSRSIIATALELALHDSISDTLIAKKCHYNHISIDNKYFVEFILFITRQLMVEYDLHYCYNVSTDIYRCGYKFLLGRKYVITHLYKLLKIKELAKDIVVETCKSLSDTQRWFCGYLYNTRYPRIGCKSICGIAKATDFRDYELEKIVKKF